MDVCVGGGGGGVVVEVWQTQLLNNWASLSRRTQSPHQLVWKNMTPNLCSNCWSLLFLCRFCRQRSSWAVPGSGQRRDGWITGSGARTRGPAARCCHIIKVSHHHLEKCVPKVAFCILALITSLTQQMYKNFLASYLVWNSSWKYSLHVSTASNYQYLALRLPFFSSLSLSLSHTHTHTDMF